MIGFIRYDGRGRDKHNFNDDAVPMTKAETIFRREEAMAFHRIHTRWPELLVPQRSVLVDTTDNGPVDMDDTRLWRAVSQVTQYFDWSALAALRKGSVY